MAVNLARNMSRWLARTAYGQRVLSRPADLSAFKRRPTPRFYLGLALMALSYAMGWSALLMGGYLAWEGEPPLVLLIGAVAVFLLVHLVFAAGAWLCGANYAAILLHWGVRKFMEKHQA